MISYCHKSLATGIPQKYGFNASMERGIQVVAGIMLTYIWSPIVFRGGHRKAENFVSSHWLTLSFSNSSSYGIEDALEDFGTRIHIIAQSKEGFIVASPWDKPIFDARNYLDNIELISEHYGADKECLRVDRAVMPEFEFLFSLNYKGDFYPKLVKVSAEKKDVSKFCRDYLSKTIIPPHERELAAYCLAVELSRAGISFKDALRLMAESPTYANEAVRKEIKEAAWCGFVTTGVESGLFRN